MLVKTNKFFTPNYKCYVTLIVQFFFFSLKIIKLFIRGLKTKLKDKKVKKFHYSSVYIHLGSNNVLNFLSELYRYDYL